MFKINIINCGILFVLTQWSTLYALNDPNLCQLPDGNFGTCIGIKQCPVLLDLIVRNSTPVLSENVIEFIRQRRCVREGFNQTVCCPTSNDLSNHPNLKLLPGDLCGDTSEDRIVPGIQAPLFLQTWTVLIAYNTESGQQFKCGGSLINKRYVITAANCVTNLKKISLKSVRVGEYDLSKEMDCTSTADQFEDCQLPVQNLNIEKVIVHPNFNSTIFSNDIALIRLGADVNISLEVHPICLPIGKETLRINFLQVAGWGVKGQGPYTAIKQRHKVQLISRANCMDFFSRKFKRTPTEQQICTENAGEPNYCASDVGGSIYAAGSSDRKNYIYKYYLYGVVSGRTSDCSNNDPSTISTNVTYYVKWILDNLEE